MSDHEFERQVQQKMDELKFSPSANVWKGIEQDLDKDRKRRWGYVWWPAALLVLLAGVGYYLNQDSQDPMDLQDGGKVVMNEASKAVNEKAITPSENAEASPEASATLPESWLR